MGEEIRGRFKGQPRSQAQDSFKPEEGQVNPACQACGGACCKGMILDLRRGMSGDEKRWLGFHGYESDTRIKLEVPCSKLKDGKCSIYEWRPGYCRTLVVGSEQCLYAIKTFDPDKMGIVMSILQFPERSSDELKVVQP